MKPQAQKNIKTGLHPRNTHRLGYDLGQLTTSSPALAEFVYTKPQGGSSIHFEDPKAVKALNAALLEHHYQVKGWNIPPGALCPPIPGRLDYIHHMADLLGIKEYDSKSKVRMLDIGTGTSGIYGLLACQAYGWHAVGSDISKSSLLNVEKILEQNPEIKKRFTLRYQADKHAMFSGIIQKNEFYHLSLCNPPFHSSAAEALKSNQRKVRNLKASNNLNFGGDANELWCNGGEKLFLKKMIKESRDYADQCLWFSSLVSKSESITPSVKLMRKQGATDIEEIPMVQGNKVTRIIAWSFQ